MVLNIVQQAGTTPVARSQAQMLLSPLGECAAVEIDFSGVERIGPAFADELVRVWPLRHPATVVRLVRVPAAVRPWLMRSLTRGDLPQPANVFIEE